MGSRGKDNVLATMKTKNATGMVLLIGLMTSGASAAPAPASSAPAATASSRSVPPPDQIITTSALPNVTDLTNAAAAQGITVKLVGASALQMTVVYEYPNGQSKAVVYQLPPPAPVVSAAPAPIYVQPAPVANDYYDPVYPRYAYPLLSFRFGFGAGHRPWR